MKKLYGIVVPVVTPLTAEGTVDVKALTDLCNHLIEKGIHCLYPCGTTGEMMNLSVDERKLVAETVMKAAAGKVTVFVHVGAMNFQDTVALAKHAEQIGADGLGVVTPGFFKLSDKALEEYYVKVANAVPNMPIYLYAIPQCAVNDITPALAAAVSARCSNVIGIKYSYPNMSRIQEFMDINDGKFSVLCGPDELLFVTMCAGGDGTVSGTAMVIPDHYIGIYDKYQAGDYTGARMLQRKTNKVANILNCSNNIARYKAALKRLYNIDGGYMRSPGADLTPAEIDEMMAALNANQNLDASVF